MTPGSCADLSCPESLALARHGRTANSHEMFLLSDVAQGRMCSLIGLENVWAVVKDVAFLKANEAPPADRPHCKFVQHAHDRRFTDLMPPQVCMLHSQSVHARVVELLQLGAGSLHLTLHWRTVLRWCMLRWHSQVCSAGMAWQASTRS